MKNSILVLFLCLSLGCVSLTNKGDFPSDQLALLENAESGDAESQERIGEIYHYGEGVKRNYKKAFFWYEKAAVQGLASAQDYLGLFYAGGFGVDKDCGKSIAWFKNAEFNGYVKSKSNRAYMLATCDDPEYRDGKLAVKLMFEYINENGADLADLDNLAAALAEAGEYGKAYKLQKEIVSELKNTDQNLRLESSIRRMDMYKKGKPWREVSYESPEEYASE